MHKTVLAGVPVALVALFFVCATPAHAGAMDQDVALGEADYEDLTKHYVKLEKAAVAGDLNAQYLFAEINEN